MTRTRYTKQQRERDAFILSTFSIGSRFEANKNLLEQILEYMELDRISLNNTNRELNKERSKPLLQIARERWGKWRKGKDL
jgi:hypothetical protein